MEGTYILSAQICLAITRERMFPGLKLFGERFNWPSNIDFTLLSDRVFYELRPELVKMVWDHITLGSSSPWTTFSKTLRESNTSLTQFFNARDSAKFAIAGSIKHAG